MQYNKIQSERMEQYFQYHLNDYDEHVQHLDPINLVVLFFDFCVEYLQDLQMPKFISIEIYK
jgi:hypothetical protein